MTPEAWKQVDEIVQAALDLRGRQRQAFLRAACGADGRLRSEVEALLQEDESPDDGLEQPAFTLLGPAFGKASSALAAGQELGAYRIVRELGKGGMGEVYLGERVDDYHAQVAIKLVRREIAAPSFLQHFFNERQILATLKHPHIPRLLDGGKTANGIPFLVMEYVEGLPLDEFCNRHALSLAERLRLFLRVCDAVAYAHQQGVIHRDLKPGNILITADGTPKLLDFGIARILSPQSFPTPVEQPTTAVRMLTTAYASPEQWKGEAVTTASDIYSLAVVLYELLTGCRPYQLDHKTPGEIERSICQEEVKKPSVVVSRARQNCESKSAFGQRLSEKQAADKATLRRQLAGDVDAILLKSLRKEPSSRYPSVERFAEDIRRHLEGLPVAARQREFLYYSAKFIRRHRLKLLAVTLPVLLLLASAAMFLWQVHHAHEQRERLQALLSEISELPNEMARELAEFNGLPNATRRKQVLAERTAARLQRIASYAQESAVFRRALAVAYEELCHLQSDLHLGETGAAIQSCEQALGLRAVLAAAPDADTGDQLALVSSYQKVGRLWQVLGERQKALHRYQQAAALCEELLANPQPAIDVQRSYLEVCKETCYVFMRMGDREGSRTMFEQALPMLDNLSDLPGSRHDLFDSCRKFAGYLAESGCLREALVVFEKTLQHFPAPSGDADEVDLHYKLMTDYRLWSGDQAGAVATSRKRLGWLAAGGGQIAEYSLQDKRLSAYKAMGQVLEEIGERQSAIASYKQALVIAETLARDDSANARRQVEIMKVSDALATTYRRFGRRQEALRLYRKVLAISQQLLEKDALNISYLGAASVAYYRIGESLVSLGRVKEAMEPYQKTIAIREELFARDPLSRPYQTDVQYGHRRLAEAQALLAHSGRAIRHPLRRSHPKTSKSPENKAFRRGFGMASTQ